MSLINILRPSKSSPVQKFSFHGVRHRPFFLFSPDIRRDAAFTLLEVMVAVAILAITLTILYGSQGRSLAYATEAHFNYVASSLASAKLAEIQSGIRECVADTGEFTDFPGFSWSLTVEDAFFEGIEILADMSAPLKKVHIKIEWDGSPYSYSLVYYGYWND